MLSTLAWLFGTLGLAFRRLLPRAWRSLTPCCCVVLPGSCFGALGVAWKIPVRGYPTLALVAAMARAGTDRAVTVCMSGGHGEWFVQDFGTDGMPLDDVASLTPDTAAMRRTQDVLAGTRAEDLGTMIGVASAPIILPNASDALIVPDALLRDQLSPLYGRAPDAKLPM